MICSHIDIVHCFAVAEALTDHIAAKHATFIECCYLDWILRGNDREHMKENYSEVLQIKKRIIVKCA